MFNVAAEALIGLVKRAANVQAARLPRTPLSYLWFLILLALLAETAACTQSSASSSGPRPSSGQGPAKVAFATIVVDRAQTGPGLDRIQVAPAQAVLSPGQRAVFSVLALDAEGRPVRDVAFQWNLKNATAGALNPTGLFTAGDALGTYQDSIEVIASSGGRMAAATVSVEIVQPGDETTRTLDTVVVIPGELIVRPGQTAGVGALAWDTQGRFVPNVQFRWNIRDPRAGSVDQLGFFTASDTHGQYPDAIIVTASQETPNGKTERQSYVSVTIAATINRGRLSSLSVIPGAVSLRPAQRVDLTARAFDGSGQALRDVTFSWEVLTPGAGSLDRPGRFIAGQQAGRYTEALRITATQGSGPDRISLSTTVDVTVTSPVPLTALAAADVTPAAITLAPGQRFPFSARGLNVDGRTVAVSVAWEVLTPTAGAISKLGVFVAGQAPGIYRNAVRAQVVQQFPDTTRTAEAFVTVNVVGPLERVEIVPLTIALSQKQPWRLRAVGYDLNGLEVPNLRLLWSVENPQVGTIDQSGLFVAGTTTGVYPQAIKVTAVQVIR